MPLKSRVNNATGKLSQVRDTSMASLTVPSNLASLDNIREFVSAQAEEAGLDDRRIYRLCLAVDEIATNIILYGYGKASKQGEVHVVTAQSDEGLEVVLEDSSPPFDPFSREAPDDLETPLEERDIGGLGIFLAGANVDEFRYEHVGGRNRNIFVMRAEASEASP